MKSDGVDFIVPWLEFEVGTSVFVPTLHPKKTLYAFRKEANIRGISFLHRLVVEDGIQGLRFWRT
jgi:hypothetical protein|tara:strand:- start:721 stop:915 length:195 start_codon:yes stop_codon:yes gene_type:complete